MCIRDRSRAITVTVKAEKDGATGRETFVITVQRDTDGDGEPDITDTDDDGPCLSARIPARAPAIMARCCRKRFAHPPPFSAPQRQ